ncbi:tetratricopeptide repeat protein [cf. Phormidesmis sp. LEGE 11477]|uniref:tetratricopeptide repeat protein n=1 Tax=cf. Phormidesmis sp. LEGE 11477 TaxID=1828680 RepID=UPI001880165B|nr:tetratricopeptide repeat protein [cf. Phormidesmis sp. LEGE 11477]MBE9059760.1 tetratricopeptide repeat protein [cf. Phormidesmis sp. LEGE 11477]
MAPSLKSVYQQRVAKLIYRRGVTHLRHQSYGKAVAALTLAIEKGFVPSAQAQVMRGISQLQLGDTAGAIADFEVVINAAANSSEELSKPESSPLELSSQAPAEVSLDIPLAQAYHHRGQLRSQSGDAAGALADWSAAIAYWPRYPEPYYNRALAHLEQEKHRQALADFGSAIAADQTFAKAYLCRGNLRHQLGDTAGAIADWELAVCNDFTLEDAKQKLANSQQVAYDAELSDLLAAPLALKDLSVKVQHSGAQLSVHIYRAVGTGVNYYTLPDLIREHLVPMQLSGVSHFQLVGHVEGIRRSEWNQSYDLYKGLPCPPSNWQAAFSALMLFPPFGIPAFIQAAQVKDFYKKGKYIEALSASKAVKGLCVAGGITLGFFTLLPLGYAAYDSMKEEPTFQVSKQLTESNKTPYQEIFED